MAETLVPFTPTAVTLYLPGSGHPFRPGDRAMLSAAHLEGVAAHDKRVADARAAAAAAREAEAAAQAAEAKVAGE